MTVRVWALFALTETVLCLTPGPAVLLVLSQGLTRGRIASLWSSLGILAGNGLYFVLSATSLGAILVASYRLFMVIKLLGAAYIASAVRTADGTDRGHDTGDGGSGNRHRPPRRLIPEAPACVRLPHQARCEVVRAGVSSG